MRALWKTVRTLVIGGVLLAVVPLASAQKTAPMPAPPPPKAAPTPAPAPMPAPAPQPAQQPGHNVVVVEPIRVFDPFFAYPYPYAYPPDYMAQNFGYVKIKTDHKDASVFVDGGFADKVEKAKKFALRPGNHNIELRDSDGRTIYREQVAVIVGKTTELKTG
jgi:hypothetical protein